MVAMTLHYHGTPITPRRVLQTLAGRMFCVSYMAPQDVEWCDRHGQSLMLDNGAFSAWKKGAALNSEWWRSYYDWTDRWLDRPTTWAVIPDVIDAGTQEQDALLREWPHGDRGAPVWHMDEPISRLVRLSESWPRVCMGSTAEYRVVGSPAWQRQMDAAWSALMRAHRRTPVVHMLRGMQCSEWPWPFASVDSTDVARNHNRAGNTAAGMAGGWDSRQCPPLWQPAPQQHEMFEAELEAGR